MWILRLTGGGRSYRRARLPGRVIAIPILAVRQNHREEIISAATGLGIGSISLPQGKVCADLLPGSIFSVSNSYLCAWIQAEVNVIAPYVHLSAPSHARIMLVGEQPGDQEDLAGRRSRRQTARRGARSRARAWRAPPSTSPTPSSTSNANRAANAGPARSGSLLPLA